MELVERSGYLQQLEKSFSAIEQGEGHCIFVSGEAGIGKTTLVKAFCKTLKKNYPVYQGSCDALFTPRPLAPLYDVLLQINNVLWKESQGITERSVLFSSVLHALSKQDQTTLIVFEDIHWADEATLDFIKFLARRISQLNCLFILTYRNDEITAAHPLRNVLGQLPPDSFTRIELPPLSLEAVQQWAAEKGYNGNDVYSISGGNPFYVSEILASYSTGVPDNIKDAVLAVYNRQEERTKQIWELLSVIPAGLELVYINRFDAHYSAAIERCIAATILVIKDGIVFFKHELYRRTIESSLSALKRISLNKRILELLKESFEQNQQLERIIHHAKNANEYGLVVSYAPRAARQAALVGAHIEAARLYLSAIEYYKGSDHQVFIELYEAYAYECYLTNRIKDAIIYTGKALAIRKEENEPEKIGNSLRFLSRLWWFDGNRKNAEMYAAQAIEMLDKQPPSGAKAMAYSNMSQLSMLAKHSADCIFWGEKAIAMAEELELEDVLSHAQNNVGTIYMKMPATVNKGLALLKQSLQLALKNSYHEHVARAYTNISSISVERKDYAFAEQALEDGIQYCEERDLDSWYAYMSSWKTRLLLETGRFTAAAELAERLLRNEQPPVVKIGLLTVMATLKMRRGESGVRPLLAEACSKAFETMELQRVIPAMVAALEYEWITGNILAEDSYVTRTIELIGGSDDLFETSEFAFWLRKARSQCLTVAQPYEGFDTSTKQKALQAACTWKKLCRPYEQAIILFEGNEASKREAISIIHDLGAAAVYEKMKQEMRVSGIRSIPRGIRKTTRLNPAGLTEREMDILPLLKDGLQNREIASRLYISAKTVDHHISSILFKLDVNSRTKAVHEAVRLAILK